MSQALYRKWRPKLWDEVVGQDHIVQTLKNAISVNRVGHAYLFSGPRGTGKTTTARLLAKAVNCTGTTSEKPCDQCLNCLAVNDSSYIDLIEIDAATNTGVDDVRDLRDKINFAPNQGQYKVYIIDEVHMFTNSAFNALLKTLEEPPPHAIFILATTELHKIPATILSRCQRYEFRRIPVATMVDLLGNKAKEEGFEVHPDVLTLIARQSTGSMRDAISLLDQLSSTSNVITLDLALSVLGTATHTSISNIVDCIIQRETGKALDHFQSAMDCGTEARQLARQMVDYLRNMLLARNGNINLVDTTPEIRQTIARQSQQIQTRHILTALDLFNSAANDTRRSGWQPGLGFELALAETIESISPESGKSNKGDQPSDQPQVPAQRKIEEPKKDTSPTLETNKPVDDVVSKPQAVESTVEKAPDQPPADGNEFTSIANNWRKIGETVRKINPATQALLNSCKPASLKDGVLVIAFAIDLLKAKMESSDHMENTRRAIRSVTGYDFPIRCSVSSIKLTEGKDKNTPQSDGMVSAALNELGGQVVDVQDVNDSGE